VAPVPLRGDGCGAVVRGSRSVPWRRPASSDEHVGWGSEGGRETVTRTRRLCLKSRDWIEGVGPAGTMGSTGLAGKRMCLEEEAVVGVPTVARAGLTESIQKTGGTADAAGREAASRMQTVSMH